MNSITLNPQSSWQSSFNFDHVKCLIVCRGPIRLEAIKIFKELKVIYGILISEKDSIIFPNTLAPELQIFSNRKNFVHHIKDYMGDTKKEKELCIEKIIKICLTHGYTHVFAGYGFMAEDYNFVSKLEKANLSFIGPNSKLIKKAGSKDEAKKLARSLKVSVIPGEDNVTALTLLDKAGNNKIKYFRNLIQKYKLNLPNNWESFDKICQANALIEESYLKNIDLFSISDLQKKTVEVVKKLFLKNPNRSIRFKHILGGGGKGQRIVNSLKEVPEAVMAILVESKSNGVGDNKNFLIELNLENTRHIEIQVIGNGEWYSELGGRDCSLQIHEQKLLEFSLTEDMLKNSAKEFRSSHKKIETNILRKELKQLRSMCLDAEKFAKELKLDSVSTFECIVDSQKHYFMEVNTRVQVEHRVTEMAYKLKFTNPNNPDDYFFVNSIIGAMLLINCFGKALPKPERITNCISGIEARINSTNASLNPRSGGTIFRWSEPNYHEIRDDQGIGNVNKFTGFPKPYKFSGAYDSNIALSITRGISRKECLEKLTEILRKMEINGNDLNLNTNFLYSILHWFIKNGPMLKPNTNFVSYYLAIAGKVKELIDQINLELAWNILVSEVKKNYGETGVKICEKKFTLILRPLKKLFSDIHLLLGWISFQQSKYNNEEIKERENPNIILNDLYHYLNLDQNSNKFPIDKIWDQDQKILIQGITFYKDLMRKFEIPNLPWPKLNLLLNSKNPPEGFCLDNFSPSWEEIIPSHKGHQLGMELLRLPIAIAKEGGFFELRGNNSLEIEIPIEIHDLNYRQSLISKLTPTFSSNSNQIIASSGGVFYARENPNAKDFVKEGESVEKGQVLGLLEVMKMFNEIRAPSSGTILKKCFEKNSGILVKKGQILYLIEQDKKNKSSNNEQNISGKEKLTSIFMKKISSL